MVGQHIKPVLLYRAFQGSNFYERYICKMHPFESERPLVQLLVRRIPYYPHYFVNFGCVSFDLPHPCGSQIPFQNRCLKQLCIMVLMVLLACTAMTGTFPPPSRATLTHLYPYSQITISINPANKPHRQKSKTPSTRNVRKSH